MFKKISSIIVAITLLAMSGVSVSAADLSESSAIPEDNAVFVSDYSTSSTSTTTTSNAVSETIYTLDSNGNITQSVYVSASNQRASVNNIELNTDEYLPTAAHAVDAGTSGADSYGRTEMTPVDKRVGVLLCGFNTDTDDTIEEWRYGTASLQNHDILISCAHVLWKPQYADLEKEGWATEITFYAGRQGHNTYAATSDYSNVSISMNYVNNTTYSVNENGDIVTSVEFNYDWSIIRIEDNLGGRFGWFGLHGCGEAETGLDIYTIGYPGDKDAYTQWKSPGSITSFTGNKMIYSAFIAGGNSGGPIINDGYVYGIATYHAYNSTTPWLYSGGTRMYDNLFSMIVDAREESAERWG